MLIEIEIVEKSIGPKCLLEGFDFGVKEKEKVALIGRNGVGKTTLFNIITGKDNDYHGKVKRRRGLRVVATAQEFFANKDETAIEYICNNLPEYAGLKKIIDSYESRASKDKGEIVKYTEAVERFSSLGYYNIENAIIDNLSNFQVTESVARQSFASLSGGQKRFVDLVRVELSRADLILIDEPTNHMDYVGKAAFSDWLSRVQGAVVVITHDRDVLTNVNRIVELKNKKAYSFEGNYLDYLRQNGSTTVSQIKDYEVNQKALVHLKKQMKEARVKKMANSSRGMRILEERLQRNYDRLMEESERPSFWIDQETVAEMPAKVVEKYEQYRERNINLGNLNDGGRTGKLLTVMELSLGYGRPLFEGLTFDLSMGDRIEVKGRNGAGKTTLIRAILAAVSGDTTESTQYGGEITLGRNLRVGYYEQEIEHTYLKLTLGRAVADIYHKRGITINDEKTRQVLARYLFNPEIDKGIRVENLSGGQKARLQIIKMLCHNPNLLILDEPTNHLDLPSIEELENALKGYNGAILYVSHDSYFTHNVSGKVIEI